jgi:hypothetical protein
MFVFGKKFLHLPRSNICGITQRHCCRFAAEAATTLKESEGAAYAFGFFVFETKR